MYLTKNFKLEEFNRSDTATRLKIENKAGISEITNLKRLCEKLLQPLRELYDKPFNINSGYRNTELNKAVGGVPTSQHTKGEAADVRVDNPRALLATLLESDLEFDQAILYATFLHLSFKKENNRNQVLYAKGIKP